MEMSIAEKTNPVKKHKKSRRHNPTRKIIKSNPTYRENEIKFAEFAKDKPHRIIDRKTQFGFPETDWVQSLRMISGVELSPPLIVEITVGKDFVFDNGVYKEFYRHFQDSLRRKEMLDLGREMNNFLSDFLIPIGRKVGRQKVFRDSSTGEIVGIKKENLILIQLCENGESLEAIRFHFYPKTRMDRNKKTEISKIKRKLRDYNHLLKRKYNGK